MAEANLYEPVLAALQRHFGAVGVTISLEVAATTGASDKITQAILPGYDILFHVPRLEQAGHYWRRR